MSSRCSKTGNICYGDSELPLLFEISRMINNSNNIKEIIPAAIKLVCEYIDAFRAIITILNRENSEIFIESGFGISDETKTKVRYKIGEGIIGEVVKTGKPLVVDKINENKQFLNKTKTRLLTPDRKEITFLCVPIKVDDEIVGTISIYKEFSPTYHAPRDIKLLNIIGTLIGKAVRVRQMKNEEIEKLKEENSMLHNQLNEKSKPQNIIGASGKMANVYTLIERVAKTNASVLIRGESGVGKELIADAIHHNSNRANKPLVKVNCSALPESLIESELFGHEKGSFTGAEQQRKGRFELAQGGTIFLDEIGDLPLSTQVKLLRVIQNKTYERVGGIETLTSDARIITATNRNLEKLIEDGKFREDFYYRINVFPLYIPPLRERLQDIPPLIDHFIKKCNYNIGTNINRITSSAIDMLMVYHWPGNVRELENCIENAAIMSNDGVIHSFNLPPTLQTASSSATERHGTLTMLLDNMEKQILIDTLIATKGNLLKSATQLDITERMMGIRVKKYNLDIKRFKGKST